VDRIVVVGLPAAAATMLDRQVDHLRDQGGIIRNALAGVRRLADREHPERLILLCTADAPLITVETLSALMIAAAPYDSAFYYPVVTRETMEAAFPGSRRTYGRLREGELSGGNAVLLKAEIAETHIPFWEALTEARKHPIRLARIVGPTLAVKALLRRVSIGDVERRTAKKLGLSVQAVLMTRPEIAMDVDKPHQLEMVQSLLNTGRTNDERT
jgi:CTP:molybdopterin cytidylyltransferase MocA